MKVFECFWLVFKGICARWLFSRLQPPLAFCFECFLPHTSYNIPEGVSLLYGLGWHQLEDVHENRKDQPSPPRVKNLLPGCSHRCHFSKISDSVLCPSLSETTITTCSCFSSFDTLIYFVFMLMLHLHVAWWHVQLGQLQSISPSNTFACRWWSTKELCYGLKYKIFLFIKKNCVRQA